MTVATAPAPTATPVSPVRSRGLGATVAATAGIIAVALAVAGAILQLLNRGISAPGVEDFRAAELTAGIAFGVAAVVIARRQPANALAPLMAAVALSQSLAYVCAEYGIHALGGAVTRLPLGDWAVWVCTWASFPGYWLAASLVLLLFPDGHLLSRRWLGFAVAGLIAATLTSAGWALTPYESLDTPIRFAGLRNPVGFATAATVLLSAGAIAGLCAVGGGVASMVVRYRGSHGTTRQQVKWVLLGATLMVTFMIAALAAGTGAFAQGLLALAVVPFAAGVGIAVVRYRLWDVDVVIARVLVYAALVAATVCVYVVIVVLVGNALGGRIGSPLVATVIVALGAQPLYARLRAFADRLLYGERGQPYEALSRLGQLLEGLGGGTDLLDHVVAGIAASLRLPYVAIVDDDAVLASRGEPGRTVTSFPLLVGGEHEGALLVSPRGGEARLSAGDKRLLNDLARQAATAVHAVALRRDVQRSRERLVSAREEERRRIRRDLHDELGPQLAGLALRLDSARQIVVDNDPEQAEHLITELSADLRRTVGEVRRITHGLRPPSLDDLGLVAALGDLARRSSSAESVVTIDARDIPRELPAAVEAAAFGICSEAIANAVRHSGTSSCTVRLTLEGDVLDIAIVDEGSGLGEDAVPGIGMRSMRERAEQLGGLCTVESMESGTTVHARLPLL